MADDLPVGAIPLDDLPEGAIPLDRPPVLIEHAFGTTEVSEQDAPAFREMIDRRTRRNDEITSLLGDQFDPYGTLDQGFFTQFDVARSENLADKQKKFRRDFPDGDLLSVPTSEGFVLLARPDKNSLFQELGMGAKVTEAIFSEPTAGGMIGAVGASLLFGPAVVPGAVGTFVGTTAGEFGQTAVEQARGFGTGEPGLTESSMRGGIAATADVAFRGVGRMIFGRTMTPAIKEAAMKALAAEHKIGLEPIAVGQLYGPFGRGVFRQVGATSPRVEEKITAQEQSLLTAFRAEAEKDVPADMTGVLNDVVAAQQKELKSLISFPALSRVDAGTALKEGIETYQKASKLYVSGLYDEAIKLSDDVIFNLKPAREIADEINAGVLGRGIEGDAINVSSVPSGELKSVVDDIVALNPNVAKFAADGREFTAFEQIKTLRTRLFDLKFSEDGAVRREAHRLWVALTEVMDNPISGNPEFVKAYQKASAANWLREDTLEKSFVAQALKSDTPEAVARKFQNPNNATALATIKDILMPVAPQKWEQFRTGFIVDVMNAPTAKEGISRLRRFQAIDSDGLGLLTSPSEQRALGEYLTTKAQFEANPVNDILTRQMTDAEKSVALVKNSTAGELQATYATMAAHSNSGPAEFAKMVKAGVYKDILDQATTINERGVAVLDSNKLVTAVEEWKKTGKLTDIFTPQDWRRIEMFQKYAAVISETGDIGGAMMAGGLRQQAVSAFTDATLFGAGKRVAEKFIKPMFHNSVTAAILARPAAWSVLATSQSGKLPLRNAGMALTLLERELSHGEAKEASPDIAGAR